MPTSLRVALIGPGKVAHLHAKAVLQTTDTELVAVYGRTYQKAEDFANQYNIRAYSDIYDMVDRENVDVCIVCTPHPAHREPTVAAFDAGAHVLVEKPLASSLADCDAMLEAARRNGRQLGTISQRRFYAPSLRVREAIDTGKIGKPVLGTVQMLGWRDEAYYKSDPWRGSWAGEGGGVLVNQAPHQLDLLLWYMGEAEEVYGIWRNLNHPYIEVDDTALAIVKFKNGALGNILVSNSQKPGIYGKVHIHGENGATVGVQPDGGAMFIAGMSSILEPPINDLWTVPGEENLLEQFKTEDTESFKQVDASTYFFSLQLADFCDAIRTNRPSLVTGEDGRRVVELFSAIYESTRTGLPVKLGQTT
ncbi:gfo/Idh/MocA family oxidoreductase [Fibrisoma montanum]|uniref:Gfo/Idh/MocA family oxidoreductase n=1 Tax=Fibrisoma montanum TaxID=2305895 RepID=A0A418MHR6_9BACT|nr:Gfo/Idh/MocA family oxidoreductase [Fibrisoma montanum]RIV26966.1 gfo/Idh/MocA family oxidoreductase [Fibrisoma montanum]